VLAATAAGAAATVVTGREPGAVLGVLVVAGTAAAALAVRPSAGRLILPVPVLSYLVAAMVAGYVHDRADITSATALAVHATQWIASGFFAMALATVLAAALVTVRWYLHRRQRPADPPWPAPAPGRGPRPPAGREPVGTTGPRAGGPGATGPRRPVQPPGAGSPKTGGSGRPAPQPPRGRGQNPYNFSSGA
jgi:hypothetical protein